MRSSAEGPTAENIEAPAALAPNRLSTSMRAEEGDLTPASGRGVEADVSAWPCLWLRKVCQVGDEDWKAKMLYQKHIDEGG